VSKPDTSIDIIWDEATIPRERLAADKELIQLLALRSMASRIGRQGSRQSTRTSSSGSSRQSTRTTSSSSAPTTPSSDVLPASPTGLISTTPASQVLPRSAGSTERQVPASFPLATPTARQAAHGAQLVESDDEVEIVSFRPANGEIQTKKPVRKHTRGKAPDVVAPASPHRESFITVVLIAWHADTVLHTAVKLRLQNGDFMVLSMVADALQTLKLNKVAIDRYITNKGWNRILTDTLFRVQDGDIISLKPSSLQHVKDFGIHAAHLY
ncbi:hypothetical protein F5880DRAFT_1512618, partial [Lentinula raphanica]